MLKTKIRFVKRSIRFSNLAFFDLEAIIEYVHNQSPKTASKYYNGIMESITRLRSFPEIGRIVPEFEEDFIDKYREIIFENYRIIYRTQGPSCFVVRIIDSRRLLTLDFVKTMR